MTASQVPVHDPEGLRHILGNTEALLLDFDGPICSIFAGMPAHFVADQLRIALADGGHTDVPSEIEKTDDPFDVLRYAATLGQDEARYVEASLRAHEVEAVVVAKPTLHAHDLIRTWHATGRKLAIVSNNSANAIEVYLHAHHVDTMFSTISARRSGNSELLKPNPHLLYQAANELRTDAGKCTLIGDSISDVQAANVAGMASIGFANKAWKAVAFVEHKPSYITANLSQIVEILQEMKPKAF